MFYSHEILTSRKHGVATIWLVATVGSKSNHKKVTRKAILDVDVQKACNTIMEPEVPMALRLSSNLLYGVSKVYSQQCSYVLADAQTAQNHMKTMLQSVHDKDLDQTGGKTRRDQLILADDPAFIPDIALPPLDLSALLDASTQQDSQHSSQSMLSPGRGGQRHSSVSSQGSLPGLNIGSSISGSYQLPGNNPFIGSSAQKPGAGTGRSLFDDEIGIFQDDLDFDFDAEGNMREIPDGEREARRAGSVVRVGSDSAASAAVRKEHEDTRLAQQDFVYDIEGDINMDFGGEEMALLPEAEPFPPMMSGALQEPRQQAALASEEPSSDTAEAPLKQRKPKAQKVFKIDKSLVLKNSEMAASQQNYLSNMAKARNNRNQHKSIFQAKKNAQFMLFGSGLGGVGNSLDPNGKFFSPLAELFAGDVLMSRITGVSAPSANQGTKRPSPFAEQQQQTPKRSRPDIPEEEIGLGLGLGDDDDMNLPAHDHSSIELGREAPSALQDYPSSAVMPWNVSTSVHSHSQASHRVLSQTLSARGRLTSASPLIGRGSAVPGELERFSQTHDDELQQIMYGRSESSDHDFAFAAEAGGRSSSQAAKEFEIFGQAANVDTQTAGQSQWLHQALDRESGNFLEYVRNIIEEKKGSAEEGEDGGSEGREGEEREKEKNNSSSVTFEELFDPEKNSAMVAAQAFYHVLSLASKGGVWVEQEVGGGVEAFGVIRIGVVV